MTWIVINSILLSQVNQYVLQRYNLYSDQFCFVLTSKPVRAASLLADFFFSLRASLSSRAMEMYWLFKMHSCGEDLQF